jgi:hypothetical protein
VHHPCSLLRGRYLIFNNQIILSPSTAELSLLTPGVDLRSITGSEFRQYQVPSTKKVQHPSPKPHANVTSSMWEIKDRAAQMGINGTKNVPAGVTCWLQWDKEAEWRRN